MNISSVQATLEVKCEATLGECPVWDEQNQLLYWVDILSGKLFRYDPVRQDLSIFEIGEHLGSFALREERGAILAMKTGFYYYDFEKKQSSLITDPEKNLPNNRFNDGKCDPKGRFWAGTLSYDLNQGAGSLYCLDKHGQAILKASGFTIPNGMAWEPVSKKFYLIDSPERCVYSFEYDEDGSLHKRTVVIKLEEDFGMPDGMTIDNENKLWIALYNGFKVIRVDPVRGDILFEISLPVPQVTSCTFGGADLNEIYITTAREHMSDEDIREAPLSGSLFKAILPFKGQPATKFAG